MLFLFASLISAEILLYCSFSRPPYSRTWMVFFQNSLMYSLTFIFPICCQNPDDLFPVYRLCQMGIHSRLFCLFLIFYKCIGRHRIKAVTIRKDYQKSHLPAVLIVDDSDLPKTGLRMECIGKIFSHVFQRCILGYKLLALCWSDGRSQFVVDFSIHGERGKVDGKEQGLTARQRERRYNRKRDRDCQTEKRKEEYFVSKLERLKSMVKRPLEDCSPIYMKAYTSSPSWKRSGQSLLM